MRDLRFSQHRRFDFFWSVKPCSVVVVGNTSQKKSNFTATKTSNDATFDVKILKKKSWYSSCCCYYWRRRRRRWWWWWWWWWCKFYSQAFIQ